MSYIGFMKTLVNVFLILIFSFSNAVSGVLKKNKLQSGWYMVTDNQISNSIKLDESEKVYKIEKEIFISVKSIINIELAMEIYGNKNNPILNFTLDKDASAKLRALSYDFGNDRQIALVIKNKFIQVSTIRGRFSGNKVSLAGKFTKEELLELKKIIEVEKS